MKKKIIAIVMLIAVMLAFTGCMKITYHITLNNNGTADAEYEIYMDKATVSMIMGADGTSSDIFAENKAAAESAGFTVTPVETDTQTGFKASAKKLELDINSIVSNVAMGGSGDGGIQVKKGLFKNTYTINANIDTTNIFGGDETSQSMIPLLNNSIDMKLIFTAPSEIKSETGVKVDNIKNTYEYKILLGQNNEISFSYSLFNVTGICIFAGLLILIGMFLVFYFVTRSKRKVEEIESFLEGELMLAEESGFSENNEEETALEDTDAELPEDETEK